MLVQRGVDGSEELVAGLGDLDGALGALVWWDDMPHEGSRAVTTGLLVKKLREGGLPGYRRPHERDEATGTLAMGPDVIANVRGQLLSPEGFDREEAREHLAKFARGLNTPVDALIDSAVGAGWTVTPPHPAVPQGWSLGWEPLDEGCDLRYIWALRDGDFGPGVKNPGVPREPLESDWNFARRFWGWEDPPVVERMIRRRREEEALVRQKAAEEALAQPEDPKTPGNESFSKETPEPTPDPVGDARWGADPPWDDEDPGPESGRPDPEPVEEEADDLW